MTFSSLVLFGPLSLTSLARSAAVQSPLSATISQLNKDDGTAFLFLYVFLFTENKLFQFFSRTFTETFYRVTLITQATY
jgi:hypothetical protein